MRRRAKRPSKYRFLAGGGIATLVLIATIALRLLESGFCGLHAMAHVSTCSIVSPVFYTIAFGIELLGCAYSAYRFYRDFYKGDYYIELAEAGLL
jgi:hypothetical protein